MRRSIMRCMLAAAVVAAGFMALAPVAQAQETRPSPVVIVGNTRFVPLFENVTLRAGETMERALDVSAFTRLGILAAAESAPNFGRVVVRTLFAPPRVPVRDGLDLAFEGGRQARNSAHIPVLGPRLIVQIGNPSNQPVEVSLSVFAAK